MDEHNGSRVAIFESENIGVHVRITPGPPLLLMLSHQAYILR
jgi:hypothetical protein